jgi:hypothetical protein
MVALQRVEVPQVHVGYSFHALVLGILSLAIQMGGLRPFDLWEKQMLIGGAFNLIRDVEHTYCKSVEGKLS